MHHAAKIGTVDIVKRFVSIPTCLRSIAADEDDPLEVVIHILTSTRTIGVALRLVLGVDLDSPSHCVRCSLHPNVNFEDTQMLDTIMVFTLFHEGYIFW